VLSFVAATLYSEYRTGEIERAALDIEGKAAPSIRRLANARAELRRLQLLVHRALDDVSAPRRTIEIDAGRALLDEEIVEYTRLPMYPSEVKIWEGVKVSLARLDADVTAILAAVGRGDMSAARASQERLDDSSEGAAHGLSQAIDANVAEASRLAGDIGNSRRRGLIWALGLDGAGVALAVVAAMTALRISRAHGRTVQSYREMAERKAEELDQFATRMAHDIRTPIAVALLVLESIERQSSPDERVRRTLDRGRRALRQTTNIIEALLDFARAGARPHPGARSSVVEAAREIATVFTPQAERVGAEIVVHAESEASVPCAEGVLASAIANLVGNALSYVEGASQRRVTIDVTEEGGAVKTTVSDTGPGLPQNLDPATLFEPYVRGPSPRGSGVGLGLATVKRMVDAHGGRVGVRSSSTGCAFWFTIPTSAPVPIRAEGRA
jgi:signal transduction histidine kinase